MPHGKGVADVDKIPHSGGKVLKILVLCLITHCPMPDQWANTIKNTILIILWNFDIVFTNQDSLVYVPRNAFLV